MKVYAPNKNYTGVSASVTFCNGAGETDDPRLLDWFRDHGYEVETPEPEAQEPEAQEPEAAERPEKRTAKKVGE
ncbi:hypothetical protein [Clostridium sp. FS41]|uniref:hypothetical protein n=1 Tax=Clostridium sp. FS41 TaxID=1609975 RepID=UPI0005D32333|nr:hypothetical protein [Clostridium sp. FS41]KJJ66559.1 hypothetical protein CLFS41_50900 [Clostridium sp. FS41]